MKATEPNRPQATGIEIAAPSKPGYESILTPEALAFVADLERRFGPERRRLLARRAEVQAKLDDGWMPDFLSETRDVRASDWTVAPLPEDLRDRRVEITGPTDRKMVINALNCGANVFMPDFEDANSPTWDNMIEGQINLRDAVAGTLEFTAPDTGKEYRLNDTVATLVMRPRGWHLPEAHALLDGEPVSGALFDFGLYFFHNARRLVDKGSGPYFYLPKIENHLEARLWNDVFLAAEQALGLPRTTTKATVLIETLLSAFEMDEILYELRDHAAGLNCGRWDYIFSFIKNFSNRPDFVLPDREQITMTRHFLRSYSLLLIKTCHRRNVHAMGGMAAQIPIKGNPEANDEALAKVRADKEREAGDGNDGTWVAHPGLVSIAKEVFDRAMPGPNQIHRVPKDATATAADLLAVPEGTITERGLRHNLKVGVQYLESWLGSAGCVPLYHLMEDAATAEICRAQVWQWLRHGVKTSDNGRAIDEARVKGALDEAMAEVRGEVGEERFEAGRFDEAVGLFRDMILAPKFVEFLTLPAYERLVARGE